MRNTKVNTHICLVLCILLVALLCLFHIKGNSFLVLGLMFSYLVYMVWGCVHNIAFPMLLFFLPWSDLMRPNPNSFSFYTFSLVIVCVVTFILHSGNLKRYSLTAVILLLLESLIAKLTNGHSISYSFLMFILMLFLFPIVKGEYIQQQYSIYTVIVFFSLGICIAAITSMFLSGYRSIEAFIRVDSYSTIIRRCGFYSDPNFYIAQITAALAGCMLCVLKNTKINQIIFLCILIIVLVYCGFLSGSKSFVLISMCIFVLWCIQLCRLKGRYGLKFAMSIMFVIMFFFIAVSTVFEPLIDVLVTRFSHSSNLSDFTTHRSELWVWYLEEILSDWKLLLLGHGFTNVKLNGRGSHNSIIQLIWQFGILGAPIVIGWVVCFFRDMPKQINANRINYMMCIILTIGTFLPWLAIDIMFFDEFFLMQMYMYIGIQQLCTEDEIQTEVLLSQYGNVGE